MQTTLFAYLSFRDNAREALEFYHRIFGGKLTIHTFSDFNAAEDPADANKVMHGMLETDNGIRFAASDTPTGMDFTPGSQITLALSGDNEAELKGYFEQLSEGGKVTMPLAPTPWAAFFGMLVDKFGIDWMVNIAAE